MRVNKITYRLGFIFALLFISCGNTKLHELNGEEVHYSLEVKNNKYCKVYTHKLTGKKLNGFYSFNYGGKSEIRGTAFFKKGIMNGVEKVYVNDTLKEILNYHNGFLDGEQIKISSSDSIISNYKEGIQDGALTVYCNKKIIQKANFNNGLKSGDEEYFTIDGKKYAGIQYSYTPYKYKNIKTENFKVYDYFLKYLEINEYDNLKIYGSLSDDLLNFYSFTLDYKYLGEVNVSGYINLDNMSDDCNFSRGYFYDWNGLVSNLISETHGITLPTKEYDTYLGYFYTVDIGIGELDMLSNEKWIIVISKLYPESYSLVKIE